MAGYVPYTLNGLLETLTAHLLQHPEAVIYDAAAEVVADLSEEDLDGAQTELLFFDGEHIFISHASADDIALRRAIVTAVNMPKPKQRKRKGEPNWQPDNI